MCLCVRSCPGPKLTASSPAWCVQFLLHQQQQGVQQQQAPQAEGPPQEQPPQQQPQQQAQHPQPPQQPQQHHHLPPPMSMTVPPPSQPNFSASGEGGVPPPPLPGLPPHWQMQMSSGMLGFPNLMFAPNLSHPPHLPPGGLQAPHLQPPQQPQQGHPSHPHQQSHYSLHGRAPNAQAPP